MAQCSHCSIEIESGAQFCPSCGQPVAAAGEGHSGWDDTRKQQVYPQQEYDQTQTPLRVENHLVKAIIVTVLCCLPMGIVAIVYAASVNGKLQAGDYAGAVEASQKANSWANWGLGIGLALIIISTLIQFLVIGSGIGL